jgi:predicted nucleotidyltransferase
MPAPETFCDVLAALNRENVRYVVVGGLAVVMHGHKRDITDLDIVVEPSPNEAQRCLNALACAGFIPTIPLPVHLLTVIRLLDPSMREVDLFVRFQIPFAELWSNSKAVKLGIQTVRIAALEHLLRLKLRTPRPHDDQDVEALTRLLSEMSTGNAEP